MAVEAVAAAALRSRLRSYDGVDVKVSATAWDLLSGRIDAARVEGRGWESPQGLTARVLDVHVGRVELDLPAVVAQQRIVLRNIPTGGARAVFNARDFGAFLQHQLVLAAARRAVRGLPFLFDRGGVQIIPGTSGTAGGCVIFSGAAAATGQRYQLLMRPTRGGRAAAVSATPIAGGMAAPTQNPGPLRQQQQAGVVVPGAVGTGPTVQAGPAAGLLSVATAGSGDEDPEVSSELTRFFSTLTVDLQGAELAFREMRITRRADGASVARPARNHDGEGLLELDLEATVRSFPPLNIQF